MVAIIEIDDAWTKIAFTDVALGRPIGYVATTDLAFEPPDGVRFARSAQHVVLKDEKKSLVLLPLSKEGVNQEVSNAIAGRTTFNGLRTAFDMAAVRTARGAGDGEFLVVVIGDKGSEREFKVK